MGSRYDDELWALAPSDPPPPAAPASVAFARELGAVGDALDLGCGDGRLSAELQAERLTVADVSPVALDRARLRVPAAAAVELEPDTPLPFADNAFDLVHCADTLEHVRDVQLLLSEARRVLRPAGRLAVTTPAHGRRTGLAVLTRGFERSFPPLSPHLRFFTRRSLRGLLGELGFEVVSLRSRSGVLMAVARR